MAAANSAPANLAFCNIVLTGGAPFGCSTQALTHQSAALGAACGIELSAFLASSSGAQQQKAAKQELPNL
jgi:hypothetical protein